jgi:ATP-dependent Clp protease, protease subunit|tara:strand:- start:3071 stop:3712 length:642 start_codon:yes stop_codon:yes gene_type:complete
MNPEEEAPEEEKNDLILFPELFSSEPKSRILGLYGEVNEESCKTAVASIYYFRDSGVIEEVVESEEDEESVVKISNSPINFIVSTEGGSVTDMFAVYDCMRDVRKDCEIISFGVGKVMSAGVLLLAGGTKGKRKVGRNCRLMLHAISGGHFGSLKELETDIREVRWYQTQYVKALADETNMSEKQIRTIFRKKTDTYFDAEQAVKWGIADEMV